MATRTIATTALAILVLGGCNTPVSTDADCADWNTKEYFWAAMVKDVTACLQSGADLNARSKHGRTLLHLAASSNENPAVLTVLLDVGAELKAQDGAGKIPWDYAKDNEALKVSNAYWRLNDARF